MLTRVIANVSSNPLFDLHVAQLEADRMQRGVPLPPIGWLDDWLLLATSLDSLAQLLNIWDSCFGQANWKIKWSKTEILGNASAFTEFTWRNQRFTIRSTMKYLGCILSSDGSARSHVQSRVSLYFGAWGELCKQFQCHKYSLQVKNRIFVQILMPTLCHGFEAYALTGDDFALVRKAQNQIQRTFLCPNNSLELAERWRDLHSRLRDLRSQGKLADMVDMLETRIVAQTWDDGTCRLLNYRGTGWQRTFFPGKPKRRRGRPCITLLHVRS